MSQSPARCVVALSIMAAACGVSPTERGLEHALELDVRADAPPRHETVGRCRERDPNRRAFFGDLHVHTSLSLDAHLQGNRMSPDDAYRFARGERVGVQPHDEAGRALRSAQLERPLDFAAVTDHAEFLGVVDVCEDPDSEAYESRGCRMFREDPDYAFIAMNAHLVSADRGLRYPRLCGDDAERCLEGEVTSWVDIQNAAERHYDRTEDCAFTTFVAYEWSASPALSLRNVANLHRNVIFRSNVVPRVAAGYLLARNASELFDYLEQYCIEDGSGCDALAIPHNANLSSQMMFEPWTSRVSARFTARHAARRRRHEPVHEIIQHKGASECVPWGPAEDEACGFEMLPYTNLAAAKRDRRTRAQEQSMMRYGLGRGLALASSLGANPFEVGFIGSTDTHLGLPGAVEEDAFLGGGGAGESGAAGLPDRIYFGGGGLAGVWAEENSRGALFDAIRRREVFGTSGTRIRVRTFMGDDVPDDFCGRRDRIEAGIAGGVPMGARLPSDARAPRLAVVAQADLGTPAHPGARLQRIELVRGVLREGGSVEVTVSTIAGDPTAGEGRDPFEGCAPPDVGDAELCAVIPVPDFDPEARAYYYVRVLEVPTCRWSTRQCLAEPLDCTTPDSPLERACCRPSAGLHPRRCATVDCASDPSDACCEGHRVEPMIRERAWSSPVYTGPE